MGKRRTIAQMSLRFTGAFEADVLVFLLLRQWNHPLSDDESFRNNLLDCAANVLRASTEGQQLFEDLSPANVNLIAAIWFAEATSLDSDPSIAGDERALREAWLNAVRRSIPSCFCEPDRLF